MNYRDVEGSAWLLPTSSGAMSFDLKEQQIIPGTIVTLNFEYRSWAYKPDEEVGDVPVLIVSRKEYRDVPRSYRALPKSGREPVALTFTSGWKPINLRARADPEATTVRFNFEIPEEHGDIYLYVLVRDISLSLEGVDPDNP